MNTSVYFLARVGNYPGDIKELVKRHSDHFPDYSRIREDANRYSFDRIEGEERYTTILLESDLLLPHYNKAIIVVGPRIERASEIMEEFLDDIGIETEVPPKHFLEQIGYSVKAIAEARVEKARNRSNN